MAHVGYIGVIIPSMKYWQGFFIDDEFESAGEMMLKLSRQAAEKVSESMTLQSSGQVAPEDEIHLGSLSAVVLEGALANNALLLCGAGMAIKKLSGKAFFIIEGEKLEKGTKTTIEFPDVESVEAFKDYFQHHPLVAKSKVEVLLDMIKDKDA